MQDFRIQARLLLEQGIAEIRELQNQSTYSSGSTVSNSIKISCFKYLLKLLVITFGQMEQNFFHGTKFEIKITGKNKIQASDLQ